MKPFPDEARPSYVYDLRRLLLALICGICPLLLAAQQNDSSQQTYAIRGSVINKSSGQPIARALVRLQGPTTDVLFTDSDGRFEFDNVIAGSYSVAVKRPGFTGSQSATETMQRIQAGPDMSDALIAMFPTGSITGQVTLSTSDSAGNIPIHLLRQIIESGRARWQQISMAQTNSDGVYSFMNLQPGNYRVFTSGSIDPDPSPGTAKQRWGFEPEYFPGKEDSAAIHLRPGEQAHADLVLTHEPFYPVTVAMDAESRRGGFNLQVYDIAGHLLPYPSRLDREAGMNLDLPKGRYRLECQSFGAAPMFGSAEITAQGAPMRVAMPLLPMHPIAVTIRREFTAQSGGIAVSQGSGQPDWISAGMNIMLRPLDGGSARSSGTLRHAPGSSDNSSFILENIRPGSYWVQTFGVQGYVASITSGGTDLAQKPLVIGPGGTSPPIEVVLRNDTASVSISANTSAAGAQPPSAYVAVVPDFATTWQAPDRVQLGQNALSLGSLPPGPYRIFAFDEPQQLEYSNPEAMRAYAGKGQAVTLESGGSAKVSVDIIATDSMDDR